ncbi:MAG: two-component regulator propeller domain-containing protein [Spirosomataceae bacterium]
MLICFVFKRIVRAFLLGLLILKGAMYAYGQPSSAIFQQLSTEQGLPNFYTTATVQDNAGFIWIGTFSGLVRYDGHRFKTFTHEQGNPNSLSSNYIRTVFVARTGVIWVGTELGLNRFDLHTGQFERFYFTQWGDICNNVRFITEDAQGILWLGTQGGVFAFNPHTKHVQPLPLPAEAALKKPANSIHHILINSNRLWIGTDMGLYSYHTDTKSFEVFRQNNALGSIPENAVFALAQNNRTGHIAVASRNSTLALFDPKTKHFRKAPLELGGGYTISTLICAQDGTFWGGTYGSGVFSYDETREKTIVHQQDIFNVSGLSSNIIINIFQDRSGLLWLCTARNGVSRFNPATQIFNYPFEEVGYRPLSANGMMANKAFVDKLNHLWIATDDGLVWINAAHKQYKHYRKDSTKETGLLEQKINTVHVNQQGRVWVGTNGHFYEFNPKTEIFKRFTNLPNEQNPSIPTYVPQHNFLAGKLVFDMVERTDGRIFIGTDEGLNLYDPKTQSFSNRFNDRLIQKLPPNYYHTLYIDSHQNLWVGCGLDEVICVSPDLSAFQRYRHQENDPYSLTENDVMAITEDSQGNIWMGTDNGLGRLDVRTQRFKTFTVRDGLPNNNIPALFKHGKYIWIGTSNGLCRYDESTGKFESVGRSDNLKVLKINMEAATKDQEGNLLFGGAKGLVRFGPNSLSQNTFIPPAVITSVSVYGKEVLPEPLTTTPKTIILDHDENDLNIEVAALNYDRPEKNSYTFWLENGEKTWSPPTHNPSLNYLNLPPGEYALHVKAANSNGLWNPQAAHLAIIIRPPFWQTWWFRGLLFLLTAAIGTLLYQWRVRLIRQQHSIELKLSEEQRLLQNQLNQELKEKIDFQQKFEIAQQQQIETERKAILLEREKLLGRYQNLVNQLNPHFLFNSLAVLDSLIYKDSKMASKYLRQLTKVYRYLIENDHQAVVKLEQELRFANAFIELLQMRYGEGLHVDVVIPEELYDKKIVPVTLQNLIENAIKHNTTAVEMPLHISIREEAGYLVVENNLQKRAVVTTSNNKGLNDFKALYSYLTAEPVRVEETPDCFRVGVPLL